MQDWVFEAGVADSGAGMGAVLEPGLHDPNWLTNALKTDDLSLDGALFNPSFNNGDATDLDDVVSVGTRPPGPNFPGFPGNVEVNPGLTNDADSGGGGGGGDQAPNPVVQWGLNYLLDMIADWILARPGEESAEIDNFDPDDIDTLRLSGDRVFASTDNGRSWYVDLDRSAANGWDGHVRFDEFGLPWVDLGDGSGYRLAPRPPQGE